MKQKLFLLLAVLFAGLTLSAQTATLSLGGFDNASVDNDSPKYDGTNFYNAPVIPTYTHSATQFVYTADELKDMTDGEISQLKFKFYSETTEDYTSNLKVYLQESDDAAFQKDASGSNYKWFAVDLTKPAAESTFSFSGTEIYYADGELTVDLSKSPYKYTGKNLVVTVVNEAEAFLDPSQGYIAFYNYDVKGARLAVFASDKTDFATSMAADDLVKDDNENMVDNGLPVVQFTYEKKAEPQPTENKLTLGEFNNENMDEAWDGFALQNAPILFNYNHSGSQVLYLPEQLEALKGNDITSMTFALFNEGEYDTSDYSSQMKLYLQEVDTVAFDKKDGEYYWFSVDLTKPAAEMNFTQDFTQAAADGTDIHVTFDLKDKPFKYSGKTLLVTVVNDNDTDTPTGSSGLRFRWIKNQPKDDWRTFVYGNDKSDFASKMEKGTLLNVNGSEDKWKNAPAVQFTYAENKTAFSGGAGTEADPYLISSTEDLDQLNDSTNAQTTLDRYYKLTQDLTEAPYTKMIGMDDKDGIFLGHFDGDGHTVAVDLNYADKDDVALFRYIKNGSVKNLKVTGNVTGKANVAGAVGTLESGTVANITADCNVKGEFQVGGVVGNVGNPSTLTGLVNYGSVTGQGFTAGIAGQIVSHEKVSAINVKANRCVNYGTVTGKTSSIGGVFGYTGQDLGNLIENIANYGQVTGGKYYSGGLIGNPMYNDTIRSSVNFGTAGNYYLGGIFGSSKPQTIEQIYYDGQLMTPSAQHPNRMKKTRELVGDALKTEGSLFTDDNWLFADGLLPRVKANGEETSDRALLYASPVVFADEDDLYNVQNEFTVGTDNGVTWTSKNGNVTISGGKATPVFLGEDILTATLNGYSRTLNINVTGIPTGISKTTLAGAVVKGGNGGITLSLGSSAQVTVYTVAGQTVKSLNLAQGRHTLSLPAGIYIVKAGTSTARVAVK